jgi:hypothetical protein
VPISGKTTAQKTRTLIDLTSCSDTQNLDELGSLGMSKDVWNIPKEYYQLLPYFKLPLNGGISFRKRARENAKGLKQFRSTTGQKIIMIGSVGIFTVKGPATAPAPLIKLTLKKSRTYS